MGADLIGYLVKVPRKFEEDRLNEARTHLKLVLDTASTLKGALMDAKGDYENETVQNLINRLNDLFEYSSNSIEDVEDVAEQVYEGLVDDVLAVCAGRFRDCSVRDDPHNENFRIVFAGELSWGDEPEGAGYTTLKAADQIGLFPILGIV